MYLQQPRQAKVHSGSVPYVSPTSTVATACDVLEVESLGTPASTVPATTVAAGCGVLEVEPSDTPASTVPATIGPTSTVATACDVLEVESLGTPASTVPATTVAAGCGVLEVEPSDTPASTVVNVTNANETTIVLAAFYGKRKAKKTMDPHGEAIRLSKRLRKVPSRFE